MSSEEDSSSTTLKTIQHSPSLIHGCYFPSWRIVNGTNPSSMNLKVITHVFYAFAKVMPDATIGHVDEAVDLQVETDGEKGGIRACIALKRRFPIKVLISIGGGDYSQTFLLIDCDRLRKRFSRSVKSFIEKYGFDGIDVDWEHIENSGDGLRYVLLLQSLREHLPGYQITSAFPAPEWSLRNIPVHRAARYLDFINLMCYDFTGPWTPLSGHHSQLYNIHGLDAGNNAHVSCDSAVRYLLEKHIPASKIVMGIATYGRTFKGTTDIGQRALGHGTFLYKDLLQSESAEFVDFIAGAAGRICKRHGLMSYDTPATVALKAEYVKMMGLSGLFYWTGTYDAPPGPRSLMTAGYNTMVLDRDQKVPILTEACIPT